MFAIQTGSKFLNARFFLDPNSVFELTVSSTPKKYKDRSEVDRVAELIKDYLDSRIASIQKIIDSEQATLAEAVKEVARLEAKLAELIEQPYKEVAKKVPQVERKLAQARWQVNNNSVSSYRKELSRLERIKAAGGVVVKVQQTAVAA